MQSKNESFKLFLKRFQPLTVKESLVKHALYAHVLLNTLYYACLKDWRRRRTVSVGRYSVRLGQVFWLKKIMRGMKTMIGLFKFTERENSAFNQKREMHNGNRIIIIAWPSVPTP
jgi:hypothetical protein